MKIRLLAALGVLFVAAPAWTDVRPAQTKVRSCTKYTMCTAQTTTGICTGAGGDQIVARVAGHKSLTFSGHQSTGNYTCDIVVNDSGHDASSNEGTTVNASSLTQAAQALSLEANFDYLWITCPTVATNVEVTLLACPE